jgi:hypothetical protein
MQKHSPQTADPVAIIRSLTAADIEARLRQTMAEEKTLRTLLRSAKARERAMRPRGQEASHS